MKYRHILFDLDGTLTDSGEGIMNSASYAFEQLGLKVPERQELRTIVGPPLGSSFLRLGVPQESVEKAIDLYRDSYNNHGGKYQNLVYPGIGQMLQALRSAGCCLYVATSKPEDLARDILAHFELDGYFEYIAGATCDHSRETKGDVLKYLLGIIGRSERTIMVGDTVYDVNGAKEQSLPCIGVSWGYGSVPDMRSAGAEAIVNTPAELAAYLESKG